MKIALQAINELQRSGLIRLQAIGGAIGATFYLEPISTFDLDIFVIFEDAPLILSLTPIYDFLKSRGHRPEGDAVMIGDWPVQFLPAESPLLREAVEEARESDYEEIPIRVMTPEHLMAIALKTGRAKDFARLASFVESGVADATRFDSILARHQLTSNWILFKSRYLALQ